MKLLVIGIDAFSSEFFDQYLEDYDTWNWLFQQIENGEAYKETLHSIDEHGTPHTGVEWSSMYTGVMPEEHGITSHGWKKEHLDYSNIQKKTIFEKIDEEGLRQAIYSMPVTYPAPQIGNGWSISGFPSPLGTSETYHVGPHANHRTESVKKFAEIPRNIIQIKDELPRDDIRSLAPWGQNMTEEEIQEVIERACEIEQDKCGQFTAMARKESPDVAWFGTHGVDKAGHVEGLQPEGPYTREIYKEMGETCRYLIENLKPEHWIIVSDHGFQMHEKRHDRKGVFISSFAPDSLTVEPKRQKLKTQDVAFQISCQLGFDDDWIGEERPDSQVRGDEEEIKQKLEEMGYI
ncbi:MAG: alkaline phosphatase family protein [Candidatus Nanohaloarchaea archaeon]|nr:alkaline phosphatase family protein [Candidatus Nanohaloarchaea archaeon]